MSPVKQPNPELKQDLDLGILVGLLLTDGSVNSSGGHKNISFTNKSKELHILFREKIKKIFGIAEFQEWEDRRWDNIKTTFVRSTNVFKKLHQIVPSFRTKPFEDSTFPPSEIPEFIFHLQETEIIEILKVMFSTDGCICLGVSWDKSDNMWKIRRTIEFSCFHPKIKEQVSQLLNKLQIHNKIREDGIVIWRKNDIMKFREKIGFIKGVKVTKNSKNWFGFEKNQILNLAIKTFELKKKDLQHLTTKEEVINFLKSLL